MLAGAAEAELVEQIGRGSLDAEAEVCRRLGPRIRLFGLRHLRSATAADDLVQQVLLTTIEALRARRLRDPEKLAPFVLGTCRTTVQAQFRSTRRREHLLDTFGAGLAPSPPSTPAPDDERLRRCVQGLGERDRSVIVLTFYDEQTAAEAAGALGLSEGNVRVIRHRALKQLRSCMEMRA